MRVLNLLERNMLSGEIVETVECQSVCGQGRGLRSDVPQSANGIADLGFAVNSN